MRPDLGDRAQAVVAGARVVDRDLEALAVVVQQRALEQVEIVDGFLLGDLEHDAFVREVVLLR